MDVAKTPDADDEPQSRNLTMRQRKKVQTRQRISGVATTLFLARGFDQVTVAEVAEAAEVSTMTVFNYFPRKEDLFLDRIPEAVELFTSAVRGRPAAESPLAALHRLILELVDEGYPLAALRDRFTAFWRVVVDSPSLRARAREGVEELEAALTEVIAQTSPDPQPRLTAALAVAAYRTGCLTSAGRMLAGESAAAVDPDHRALLDEAFGALRRALPLS
ncbi:TetR/AcrR family transcriptional regulator [Kitasatospora sp. NPDC056731]|uniref:TetR/AcrR family transcriptional regulator n=1 Tax=Kitasatospora sp. NPDC056731 TaxID=3155422 RepID=UPI003432FC39